jgi:transposase
VLVESSTESEWVARHLEADGCEVIVADPSYAAMYGTRLRVIKTDRRDVAALAEACRGGGYRLAHRTTAAQRTRRQQLRVREHLVRMRVRAINGIRALVRAEGVRLGRRLTGSYRTRVAAIELPDTVRPLVEPLLLTIEAITPLIKAADRDLAAAARSDTVARRLMTMPGIGPVTALAFRARVDTVHRFRSPAALTAYFGLVPRELSSGERQRRGAITKAGDATMRSLLIQAAWAHWRVGRARTPLTAWAQRLASRRGTRTAVVALARRLTRVLFAMWRDETAFRGGNVVIV